MVRVCRLRKAHKCVAVLLLVLITSELLRVAQHFYSAVDKRALVNLENNDINVYLQTNAKTDLELDDVLKDKQEVDDVFKDKQPAFVKIADSRVFLYSAVGLKFDTKNKNMKSRTKAAKYKIVISGWEDKTITENTFTCCFMLNNNTILSIKSLSKNHWAYLGKARLQAKQYVCPLITDPYLLRGVSITYTSAICDKGTGYVKPIFPQKQNGTAIAVCSKLAYGDLDPNKLVEWFEVHRLFGVRKVLAYLYNLNSEAFKVFKHYEAIGMAELIDFDLPGKDIIRRDVGNKDMQSWNDEQIVAYDCQLRLHGYTYVAVVDTDEYMVPNVKDFDNAWIKYLTNFFDKKPTIAGISYKVKVHATTWGPSDNSSELFIGRYLDSTTPMMDRMKNIYMPSRVMDGSVSTHNFKPALGYTRYFAGDSEATLHHFRSCRKEWLRKPKHNTRLEVDAKLRLIQARLYQFKHDKKCYDLRRYTQIQIKTIAKIIASNVTKLRDELRLNYTLK